MFRFAHIIVTLWLFMQLAAALPAPKELLRVPRYVWDSDLTKRDQAADQAAAEGPVALSDHEKFIWASSNNPGEKAVVVSMVAWSKQSERILDMEKFSFAVESASCTEDSMSLTFIHDLIYYAAKIAWDWVNFNEMRSFVLVPSDKCGAAKSHDPRVVRSVTFNDKEKRVEMEAPKSTWKEVMNTFVLDFGEVGVGGEDLLERSVVPEKRDIIPDLDEKFRLDVGATLPRQIFQWQIHKGILDGNVTANCDNCGTEGALVFAGHVEASLGLDGLDVDRFEVSVKPDGVAAHIGLSLEFLGHLDFRGFGKPSQELNLLEIPISGWSIPGVFEFGPQIELNAGYEIGYISGSAEASTGITARIPDSAVAKLDLLNKDSVQVSGWAPQIETQPLEVEVMIDAEASIYTEIALSVSMVVLDDNGFGVDLALKVPEVTVTASGGIDSDGFCPNDPDPFGVSIEAMVGADLDLEGWKELDGNRDTLFEVDIFEKPDIFTFPPVCLSFGDVSDGYCLPKRLPQEADDDDEGNLKRDHEQPSRTTDELVPRQAADPGRTPFPLGCNSEKQVPVLRYPGPSKLGLHSADPVPIIIPSVPCADAAKNCQPNSDIKVKTTQDKRQGAAIANTAKSQTDPQYLQWHSEHIYEGNWVRDFLDYANLKLTGAQDVCHKNILKFWKSYERNPPSYPRPKGASKADSYLLALVQQLGTSFTEDRMALVHARINQLKYGMFTENDLVADGPRGRRDIIHNAGRWSCELARISATCKYYAHPLVQQGLKKSIVGIEKVLAAADKDRRLRVSGFSFEETHREFYEQYYKKAIDNTREDLRKYATEVMNMSGFRGLPAEVQRQIKSLTNDQGFRETVCPAAPRKGW